MVALDRPFRPVDLAEVPSKRFDIEDLVKVLESS